jgi:hypothetical protein
LIDGIHAAPSGSSLPPQGSLPGLLRYVSNSAFGDARKVTFWWIVLGIDAASSQPPVFYPASLRAGAKVRRIPG